MNEHAKTRGIGWWTSWIIIGLLAVIPSLLFLPLGFLATLAIFSWLLYLGRPKAQAGVASRP